MSTKVEVRKGKDGYYHILRGREQDVRVSYFKPRKIYRKFVGGHMFYLTHEKRTSQRLTLVIGLLWTRRKALGGGWLPGDLETIRTMRQEIVAGTQTVMIQWEGMRLVYSFGTRTAAAASVGKTPSARRNAPMTVEDALGRFDRNISAEQMFSPAHRATMESKCDMLRRSLPLSRPLRSIDKSEIRTIVRYWTNRPKSEKTGRQISASTVRNMVATLRQFLYWCDDEGIWQAPGRLAKTFAVDRRKLLTNEERRRAANGVETFTLEELCKLWQTANEQRRLYTALGLNCGFAQTELATLRTWEIETDEAGVPVRIARERRKSEIHGEWTLWPETARLLKLRMDRTPANKEDIVLLTRNGRPLVWYKGRSRIDSVAQTWGKLTAAAGVRMLGFKHVRKTGSSLVEQIDPAATEMYLSHVEPGMKRAYVQRDWARLGRALEEMRDRLSVVFHPSEE